MVKMWQFTNKSKDTELLKTLFKIGFPYFYPELNASLIVNFDQNERDTRIHSFYKDLNVEERFVYELAEFKVLFLLSIEEPSLRDTLFTPETFKMFRRAYSKIYNA